MIQERTLVFYKYFEKKPEIKGTYLIILEDGSSTIAHWSVNTGRFSGLERYHKSCQTSIYDVFEWTEMPEGTSK